MHQGVEYPLWLERLQNAMHASLIADTIVPSELDLVVLRFMGQPTL